MANIFKSSRANNTTPVATGLRVQASVQGSPIPIGCGQTRWSGVLIDYAGFTATPAQSPGSKGGLTGSAGKGDTGQYNYAASAIMLLGEGPISGIQTIFNGNALDFLVAPTTQMLADLNAIGIDPTTITEGNATYNTIFHSGTYTDTADSWWAAKFASHAIAYRGLSYLIFPNLALGSSPSFPAFNAECLWGLNTDISALGPDANPADWIQAFLTNADWGVQGFPAGAIGDFNTARNYWRATGMLISLSLTSASAAQSHLTTLMDALNCDFRWSSGVLDIVPYGDVAVSGNGYTYAPDATPVYSLGTGDFLPNQGSLGQATSSGESFVAFSRASVSDIFNKIQVEYLDRSNLYNPVTIYATDDASIVAQGRLRLSDLKQNHFFNLASAASMSCQLQLQRLQAGVNTYQATVGRQFVLLDVMDLVALTEPALGLANQLVRVTEIQENMDSSLTLTFEEVPLTASAPVYARQPSLGQGRNNAVVPGPVNAPVIYEPPGQLSQALQVWAAVSGSTPATWGGCTVWISTDGSNYVQLGTIDGASRMGALTAALPSVATTPSGPTADNTNTLSISMLESGGSLTSGTAADLAAMSTLCLVDDELIAYQTAALTGTGAYNLTTLLRGCYNTQGSVASHSVGAPFTRLDDSVFKWTYTNALIGQTVYLKFTSFNIFGTNEESLAAVTAYPHTLSGTPTPGIISILTATLTQVGISNTLNVTWAADPLAASYIAQYSTDGGADYASIEAGAALSLVVPGLSLTNVYVRVAGVSANGVVGPYAVPVELTTAPINYGAVLGLTYDDLNSAAMQALLDQVSAADDAIVADAQNALASATATKQVATAANGNTASITTLAQASASASQANAQQLTSLSATVGANFSTFTTFQEAQTTTNSSVAESIDTLTANYGSASDSIATLSTTQTTQATALTALSSTVTSLSATALTVSSGGSMTFAASAAPTGAYAAWNLSVRASGQASAAASMQVTANSDGTSTIIMLASRFAIGSTSSNTVPFQTLPGGSLQINGVTQINGTIQSLGVGGDGQPYMAINFGSSPSIIIDDGT